MKHISIFKKTFQGSVIKQKKPKRHLYFYLGKIDDKLLYISL